MCKKYGYMCGLRGPFFLGRPRVWGRKCGRVRAWKIFGQNRQQKTPQISGAVFGPARLQEGAEVRFGAKFASKKV